MSVEEDGVEKVIRVPEVSVSSIEVTVDPETNALKLKKEKQSKRRSKLPKEK